MGFILDGLDTEDYDRTYSDRQLVVRILRYFKPYTGKLAVVAGAIFLNSVTGTAGPIIISRGIDLVQDNPVIGIIIAFAGLILMIGSLGWGFNFIRQRLSAQVVGDVVLKIRRDVFSVTIGHDLSFYDEHSSGKVVSRITSDTQDFSNTVTLTIDLMSQFLLVILLIAWILSINVVLTSVLIAFTPFVFIIALSFRKIARKVTRRAKRVTAKINSQIQESISGIAVAKAFRQERAIYDSFATNNRQAYKVGVRRGLVFNSIFPVLGMASGVGIAVLVYAGGIAVRGNEITPGQWYLFMQAAGFVWWPLTSIASFWSQFQDGLSAAERVFALIDAEPKVRQTGSEPVSSLNGNLVFENLTFAYVADEHVLENFSLDIPAGQTIAIVGHTGAGKSSIARLVARFYEYQQGRLLVDGRDVRSLDLSQYRQKIGLVPQDPFLFGGTVAENIRYGRPEASDEDVERAAHSISNGEWIGDLADGLVTDVGSRGASLSMGQRQLVALARILLKDPAVFILDEATASVDPFTEAQIQDGLEIVMRDRTAIVIAHRLSTVKNADRIIVLDAGHIMEEGTHQQLLDSGGHYSELYNAYFRHQSLEYIESVGRVD